MSLLLRTYLPWLLLLVLISLLHIGGLYTVLRLPLEPFAMDKLYTLLTAHWVHIDLRHLVHNAASLLVVMLIVGPALNWRHWLLSFLLSSVIISLLLLAIPAGIASYAGLSGVLHGLFVTGCLGMLRRSRILALTLLLLLAGKLLVENLFGLRLLADSAFPVVSQAHLYGVLGGLLSAALIHLARKQVQQ